MNRFDPGTPVTTVADAVKEDGYAIVEGLLDADRLRVLREEIAPNLVETAPDDTAGIAGKKTKRFGRLLLTVPATRQLVREPTVRGVLDQTLKRYGPTYQIHFTGVMHVMPGEKSQTLHRDAVPFPNPAPIVAIATMWSMCDFVRSNGATVFVPGSHKWPDSRAPRREELRVAEMPAGSVLIYAANLIHGAGRCVSGERTGISLQYNMRWLAQEEIQFLAVPLDIARTFDDDLLRLMGYDLAARQWGYVGQQHPLEFLKGTGKIGGLSPDGYGLPGDCHGIAATDVGPQPDHYYDVALDD